MKSVLFLALHLDYGGIEQATISEANLLSKDFNVTIVSTYKLLDKPAFKVDSAVKVVYLLKDKPNKQEIIYDLKHFNLIALISELYKSLQILYLRKISVIKHLIHNQYDIIISTRYYYNDILSKKYSGNGLLMAREHRHHNNDHKYIKKLCNSVSDFDYFLPVSNELTNFYSDKLKLKKVKVYHIPNFLEYIPTYRSKEKNRNLIAVGRLSKEKGFIELVDIINEVKIVFPDVRLHIIGDGVERRNIENRIETLDCQDFVILHGFRSKEYINRQYENAAVYLMPSFEESFGIVLLEAQSYGIPCIAYDSAQGAREIIEDTVSGFLIKNRNRSDFIEKINLLLSDNSVYDKMSINAYNNTFFYTSNNVRQIWTDCIENN